MSTFRFNLAQVLRVRERQKHMAQQQLAAALQVAEQAHLAVAAAHERRVSFESEVLRRRKERIRVGEMAALGDRHEYFCRREQEAQAALAFAQAQVAERRERLVEAERRRKVLEKMRERRYEVFQYEEGRREQNLLDEMAQTMVRDRKGVSAR